MKFLRLLFFGCVLSAPFFAQAQNLSGHNWYFGNSANAIRFSRSSNEPSLVSTPVMPGNGGSAVASDPTNGNLLFYTNGATVYDLTGTPMGNGAGLSGNINGNQPAAVAQVPGQPNQYFVITNSAEFTTGGSINYSIVDMTLNATPLPLGDVTATKDQPIGTIPPSSEAMITIPHANGTDFWLVTHQNGTNNYAVTLFTSTGPGATAIVPSGSIQRAGNFSYNASTGELAVSPQEANRNVEIIGFDNATGTFTSNEPVLNSGVANLTTEAISDVAWSPNGQYLYISRTGEAGVQADVLQYDLSDPSLAPLSVLPRPPAIDFSYGLQMGPDSAIYHLYEEGGNFFLGKISDPDTVAAQANYEAAIFPANTISARQFPAAIPAADITVTGSFTSVGDCMNSPVAFYPTVTPTADSLVWDFGDGNTSGDWSPIHTYETAGAMTVTLTAYLNGEAHLLSTDVLTIQNFDVQINLVQDTTACSCELPFPKNPTPPSPQGPCSPFTLTADVQGSGSPQLQWYGPAGAMGTSSTLQPDSAGYYYLTATVGSCVAYAGVNIKEYDVQDQRSNIWYFGTRAGLDFNSLYWDPPTPGPTPISNPAMDAPEGTATMSDRNGQVIFYTDGDKVWNRDDVEIASGIGGDPGSTQSSIIIPVAGDETLFYIFTTQEIHGSGTYELRYVLFDLKLNNGSGGIVDPDGDPSTPPSTVLFTKSTERITGNNNWLIAHEYGNNSFRAYEITAEGISAPVISGIGSDHAITAPENGQGYMILGPQNQLTVAVNNTIEVFDFVDSTGVVTNFRPVVNVGEPGQVYGIGFSPGGQRLYATILGQNFIYELAYDSTTETYTRRPDLPPIPTPNQPGAIQRGPDGQLYVALQGSNNLGAITPSDDAEDPLTPSTFNPAAVTLVGGTNSTLGLPNFIQSLGEPLMTPGMQANDGCVNSELTFTATGKDPNIDKFDWLFGDGTGLADGGPEVAHTYTVPGNYVVSVRIYNKCEALVGEFTQTITVHPTPAEPPMLADANQNVICGNQPLTLIGSNNPQPTDTFLWNTGETTPTIEVTVPSRYSVTVTNAFGCTAADTVEIFPYFSGLDLGPDQIVCQGEARQLTAIQGPGLSYTWMVNGVSNSNTTRTQNVDTSIPGGPIEYIVTVSDAYCSTSDTVNFTINERPLFNAVGNDATTCSNNDGSITLTVTGPAGLPLTYEATGPVGVRETNVTTAGSPFTLPNLSAGIYRVSVISEVSGCRAEQSVAIDDLSLTITTFREGTCDPTMAIRVQTSSVVTGNYNIINTTTNQTYGPFAIPSDDFVTTDPNAIRDGNIYVIQIIDNGGCQASSDPTPIDQDTPLEVSIDDSNLCMDGTVLATVRNAPDENLVEYDWSGSGGNIISDAKINPAIVNRTVPATLNLHVKATYSTGALCPGIATLTVAVAPLHGAQFTSSDLCADNVTLDAAPTGTNFTYRWTRDGGVFPGGPSITVTSSGTYSVEVINTTTGCPDTSDPQQINVNGAFTVAVSPANLPCDGAPFRLTATSSRPAIGYQWLYNGAVIPNEAGANLIVRDPKQGVYTVNAVAAPDCEASAETNIMLAPSPTVTILGERRKKICPEEDNPFPGAREAVLEVEAGFSTYQWFTVDNGTVTPIPSETDPIYTAINEGTYRIVVTNPAGCPGQDQNDVFIDCDPIITAPNAFRPGSSLDANQAFGVFTIFVADEDFQVIIFNRWGEMVFQSSERNFRWNGGYNNNSSKLLPGGTYAYVIRYRSSYDPESGIKEKRGGVVLMR